MKHELQEIVAVVNNKGGVGKTATCAVSGFWHSPVESQSQGSGNRLRPTMQPLFAFRSER